MYICGHVANHVQVEKGIQMRLFSSSPKYSDREIARQLGTICADIISMAPKSPTFAIESSATIGPIIVNAKKYFGIEVEDGSIMARYVESVGNHDIADVARVTHSLINMLLLDNDIQERGRTLWSCFKK